MLVKILKIGQFWNGASSRFFKSCAVHRNEKASRETRAKIDGHKIVFLSNLGNFRKILPISGKFPGNPPGINLCLPGSDSDRSDNHRCFLKIFINHDKTFL